MLALGHYGLATLPYSVDFKCPLRPANRLVGDRHPAIEFAALELVAFAAGEGRGRLDRPRCAGFRLGIGGSDRICFV